jgi:hypothetical protein
MPRPSLGSDSPSGESAFIKVKLPHDEKSAIQSALRDGETVSQLVRSAIASELAQRGKVGKPPKAQKRKAE